MHRGEHCCWSSSAKGDWEIPLRIHFLRPDTVVGRQSVTTRIAAWGRLHRLHAPTGPRVSLLTQMGQSQDKARLRQWTGPGAGTPSAILQAPGGGDAWL